MLATETTKNAPSTDESGPDSSLYLWVCPRLAQRVQLTVRAR